MKTMGRGVSSLILLGYIGDGLQIELLVLWAPVYCDPDQFHLLNVSVGGDLVKGCRNE